MRPEKAIETLKGFDRQIIHGSRTFAEMAAVIEELVIGLADQKERCAELERFVAGLRNSVIDRAGTAARQKIDELGYGGYPSDTENLVTLFIKGALWAVGGGGAELLETSPAEKEQNGASCAAVPEGDMSAPARGSLPAEAGSETSQQES